MQVRVASRLGALGRAGVVVALVAAGHTALMTAGATPAAATTLTHDRLVSDVPSAITPDIQDGRVLSITQVGSKVIIGGTFTSVKKGATTFSRSRILAVDATTGAVDTAFAPVIDGTVETVLAGPDNSVYVGGKFSTVSGVAARNLARLNVATGAKVPGFVSVPVNGVVQDVELFGNRLYVAGTFTTYNGIAHGGLAALDATTGAVDPVMGVDVTEHHNFNGTGASAAVGVSKLAISPDGTRLVGIGNFKKADGLTRDQAVVMLLNGAAADGRPQLAHYPLRAEVCLWRIRLLRP